jgi:hypothetical protein
MNFEDIRLNDVIDVYSGKNKGCCCGCSGKYSYTERNRAVGGFVRGYEVSDDEISDRSVSIILNKMRKNASRVEKLSETQYTLELGERLYMVMLVPSKEETEKIQGAGI